MKMLGRLVPLALVLGVVGAAYNVVLEEISTVFVPDQGRVWGVNAAESASYDDKSKLLYVVGGAYRHVIDMTDPMSLKILKTDKISLADVEITDVAICGDYFIQTTDNKKDKSKGTIEIFKKYSATKYPERVFSKEVGEDVDSVRFLPGCKDAVVTVKGNAYGKGAAFKDPKGKVILVKLPSVGYTGTFQSNVQLTELDFTSFDSKVTEILAGGARFVYRDGGNKLSNDIEPGSMVVSPDGKKVYIGLQVTNAVAILDVATKKITGIKGLGMKNWAKLEMDASDEDGGIHMRKWPIYSYYQPDGLGYMMKGGKNYIVTANEGNDYDYSDEVNFEEEMEGKDFVDSNKLAASVSAEMRGWLGNKTQLGKLRFTKENGETNAAGYSKFVAFGGRSFSIWDANTMKQVYDSGDDIERRHATSYPDLFNGETDGEDSPKTDSDERSPRRGPEPESIAIGGFGRLDLIFVGIEKPGTVCVYSVLDDITKPKFEYIWQSVKNTSAPWKTLFDNKDIKGIDPETIIFLDDKRSPTRKPALIVIGVKSGSVTLLGVKLTGTLPTVSSANDIKLSLLVLVFIGVRRLLL